MPLIDLPLLSDAAFMRGLAAVLSTVKPASAGAGSGMYGTTAQIANAAGIAAIGAAFSAVSLRLNRCAQRGWCRLQHRCCPYSRLSPVPHF
jgi:uncharacterized membrane protein